MTRRERLMRTLRGESVDRPAVCFYEINGLDQDPANADPFNIYSHPSWQPVLELARNRADRIVMRGMPFRNLPPDPAADVTSVTAETVGTARLTTVTVRAGKRVLTSRTRRDRDVYTTWTVEHLLKDVDDLKAYLDLPGPVFGGVPDPTPILQAEEALGDGGIVMLDMGDPICFAAPLFSMADYLVVASTEKALFHRLLDRFAEWHLQRVQAVAAAIPGHLWRICGPEYASPPYLPPALFREYVTEYDRPLVEAIQAHGGIARIHSHGRLRDILDAIADTGCGALDPIEPPPQGDVDLSYVRERYGRQMVLFGNLEANDLELLPPDAFTAKVDRALREGTAGEGRGFVLMPSSCPYGRELPPRARRNYEIMVERTEAFAG